MDGTRPRSRPPSPVPRSFRGPGFPSGKVRNMFAQKNQNWWWTAHPAAH